MKKLVGKPQTSRMVMDLAILWKNHSALGLNRSLIMFGTLAFAIGALKACGMAKDEMLKAAGQAWEDA
jgi:hypothetical protein